MHMEDSSGRLIWNSHMDYFYRRLLWHIYVYLLSILHMAECIDIMGKNRNVWKTRTEYF